MWGQRRRRWANIKTTLGQHDPGNTKRTLNNVGLKLGQRRRRWPNIKHDVSCSHGMNPYRMLYLYCHATSKSSECSLLKHSVTVFLLNTAVHARLSAGDRPNSVMWGVYFIDFHNITPHTAICTMNSRSEWNPDIHWSIRVADNVCEGCTRRKRNGAHLRAIWEVLTLCAVIFTMRRIWVSACPYRTLAVVELQSMSVIYIIFDLIVWEYTNVVLFLCDMGKYNTCPMYSLEECCIFPNRTHMNTVCISATLVQWIRCEPLGEHLIHWTSAISYHIAWKMNNVCTILSCMPWLPSSLRSRYFLTWSSQWRIQMGVTWVMTPYFTKLFYKTPLLAEKTKKSLTRLIKWWTLMNVYEHSWTFINGLSSQFMNCVHELFIKNSSWQIMNINEHSMNWCCLWSSSWSSYGEFREQSWIFINLVGSIQLFSKRFHKLGRNNSACSWKFVTEFRELWWNIMSLISPNSVHG